jgi:hypothetical protein
VTVAEKARYYEKFGGFNMQLTYNVTGPERKKLVGPSA